MPKSKDTTPQEAEESANESKRFVHEYNILGDNTKEETGWWEINGDYVYNENGGRHTYEPASDKPEIEASDFDDLYAKLGKDGFSYLLDKDSLYGWLSPSGEWFPCKYYDHLALATRYLGKKEEELEDTGWIKVSKDLIYRNKICLIYKYSINEYQRVVLERMGVDLREYV